MGDFLGDEPRVNRVFENRGRALLLVGFRFLASIRAVARTKWEGVLNRVDDAKKKCPVPLDPWVRKNNPGRVMSHSRHQTQPLGALTPFRKFPIGYSLDANSPHRNPETICSSGKTDD
ncbi:hypothetical protein OUZ56_018475 [Daphnia magna]|uniref:Uncharacterized protein n=1 Tax=Daphnia magna TaxID=35525 RepID=A0ABQ9Z8Y2_9CRUS|nr:hypothetical protein OUZ56_018475 [Daphnia magna]